MQKDILTDPALRGIDATSVGRGNLHLDTFDYMAEIPGNEAMCDLVEVKFKSTRKAFFRNDQGLALRKGDMVCVEASPGHDVGIVMLTGSLVRLQMKKKLVDENEVFRRIYRIAKPADLDVLAAARAREKGCMIRTRQIARDLELKMKISDVEFQGDGQKAIFYYIADQRVDFRKLIRVLAEEFRIRVEMRQIGARQEAALIGGFGADGRELCSATWKTNFETISTHAARLQGLSLNPSKLTDVCGKLKASLNYELDLYTEAHKTLPPRDAVLETQDGSYYHFKVDILAQRVTYSTDRRIPANLVTISAERARAVIEMNARGEKPVELSDIAPAPVAKPIDLAEQDDLTRFDHTKRRKKKRRPEGAARARSAEGRPETAREARGEQGGGAAPQERPADRRPRGDRKRSDRRERETNSQSETPKA